MEYAKIIDGYNVHVGAPNSAIIDDVPVGNIRNNPELLAKLGYLPYVPGEWPTTGYWKETFAVVDGQVVRGFEEYVPEPVVKHYSKLRIIQALIGMGKLADFQNAMDTNTRAMWDACTFLDSSDPLFQQLSGGIAALLGLTDEEMQVALAGCEI